MTNQFTIVCGSCTGTGSFSDSNPTEEAKAFLENHAEVHGPSNVVIVCERCGEDYDHAAVNVTERVKSFLERHLDNCE